MQTTAQCVRRWVGVSQSWLSSGFLLSRGCDGASCAIAGAVCAEVCDRCCARRGARGRRRGVSAAGVGFSRGVGGSGRGGSRRSRVARNAPGLSIWFGHDQPVFRMSAFSACRICGAVQAVSSRSGSRECVADVAGMHRFEPEASRDDRRGHSLDTERACRVARAGFCGLRNSSTAAACGAW